ncbi:MAG TPA: extracellular solute-binding protein, partial [Chloroflexota bacterium]|nr:extracellular solute-binding protein [Chloroflexota bacterium]
LRLNVRAGGDEALWKFLEPQLKEKLPTVSYAVEGIAGDFSQFLEKVTVLAASAQLGDVIYSTTTSGLFDVLFNARLIRPVDDLVRADRYDLKIFFRPGTDLLTREGKLYALPNTCQPGSVVVFYNKRMVDGEGLGAGLANADWTPDEAVAAGRRLTKGAGDVWGWAPDTTANGVIAVVQSFGGRWLSKDGKKAELNTPATRQALTYLSDLIQRHKVAPPPGAVAGGALAGFLSGKVAMYTGSTSDATRLLTQTDVEVGTTLVPRVRKDLPRGIMRVDGYSLSASTKYPREAWEAIKVVAGQEGSLIRADVPGGSGTLGCTPSAWSNPEVLRKRGTMQQVFVRVLGEAEVNQMAGNYRNDEYQQAMTQRLDPVWKGEAQINDALMLDLQQAVQVVLEKPRVA